MVKMREGAGVDVVAGNRMIDGWLGTKRANRPRFGGDEWRGSVGVVGDDALSWATDGRNGSAFPLRSETGTKRQRCFATG